MDVVILNSNGTKSVVDSSIFGGAGGINLITDTIVFDFGIKENNTVFITILNTNLTNSNFKSFSYVPLAFDNTYIDDFNLNHLYFNIENIVDNISFDIRATAFLEAKGLYKITYKIQY